MGSVRFASPSPSARSERGRSRYTSASSRNPYMDDEDDDDDEDDFLSCDEVDDDDDDEMKPPRGYDEYAPSSRDHSETPSTGHFGRRNPLESTTSSTSSKQSTSGIPFPGSSSHSSAPRMSRYPPSRQPSSPDTASSGLSPSTSIPFPGGSSQPFSALPSTRQSWHSPQHPQSSGQSTSANPSPSSYRGPSSGSAALPAFAAPSTGTIPFPRLGTQSHIRPQSTEGKYYPSFAPSSIPPYDSGAHRLFRNRATRQIGSTSHYPNASTVPGTFPTSPPAEYSQPDWTDPRGLTDSSGPTRASTFLDQSAQDQARAHSKALFDARLGRRRATMTTRPTADDTNYWEYLPSAQTTLASLAVAGALATGVAGVSYVAENGIPLPDVSGYIPSMPTLPSLPSLPTLPSKPSMPSMSSLASYAPDLSGVTNTASQWASTGVDLAGNAFGAARGYASTNVPTMTSAIGETLTSVGSALTQPDTLSKIKMYAGTAGSVLGFGAAAKSFSNAFFGDSQGRRSDVYITRETTPSGKSDPSEFSSRQSSFHSASRR